MAKRELTQQEELRRRTDLEEVRKTFPYSVSGFLLFVQVCLNTLIPGNPDLNPIQADICKWLFGGPLYRMIQAQRGQAKTTLTAIYAVFRIIHTPVTRIIIFSAGGKMSKKISTFIIQILSSLDFLWMLKADKAAGDRSSIEGYDVNWLFKGAGKDPSIECLGIDSNSQGPRSDILIADDIESLKNSRTVVTREYLEDLTKEFESICSHGDIIYLGTPQSQESIYNNLPSRGYAIRIWPGRYPTVEQEENYGKFLAPMIIEQMAKDPSLRTGGGLDCNEGKPTCPEMFPEEVLLKKRISQGEGKFNLQYMLNTKITDEERYPLKLKDLVVCDFSPFQGPVLPIHSNDKRNLVVSKQLGNKYKLYRCVPHTYELRPFEKEVMYIDPAGGGKNGDEMAFACIKTIGAYVYLFAVGGVKGGYDISSLEKLVKWAKDTRSRTVYIEKNYGNGAHANLLKPLFAKCDWPVNLEEVSESGQKELRIIDGLEPLVSSHRLIVAANALEWDGVSVKQYPVEIAETYRFVHQFKMITRDRNCLRHDDRLDAVAGAVNQVQEGMDFDTKLLMERRRLAEEKKRIEIWQDPMKRREELTHIVSAKPKRRYGRNMFDRRMSTGSLFRR